MKNAKEIMSEVGFVLKPEETALANALQVMLSNGMPPLFLKAFLVSKRKAEDYNSGSVKREDYFPFGHKSFVQMIHTKSLRLVSLVESGGQPNFEGINDTVVDMANYLSFFDHYLTSEDDHNEY